ncbi:MAG: hypothetical protein ACREP6_11865, partial [Candidatus Binataceae bacterium]
VKDLARSSRVIPLRSAFVIPARVSDVRGESRIKTLAYASPRSSPANPGFFARQPRARMTENGGAAAARISA